MLVVIPYLLFLLSFVHIIGCNNALEARANCNSGYTRCSPSGAMATDEPPIGNALSTMYVDVVNSVQTKGKQTRNLESDLVEVLERAAGGSLCCMSMRVKEPQDHYVLKC